MKSFSQKTNSNIKKNRELTKTKASVVLIDGADDVTQGATKGNSGIVHAGLSCFFFIFIFIFYFLFLFFILFLILFYFISYFILFILVLFRLVCPVFYFI